MTEILKINEAAALAAGIPRDVVIGLRASFDTMNRGGSSNSGTALAKELNRTQERLAALETAVFGAPTP